MKKELLLIAMCSLFLSCSQTRKQRLENQTKDSAKIETLVSDTFIPSPGIKYKESRVINPAHPPIVIDLQSNADSKELDLAQYYSEVKYIKITHPLAEQGIGFLGNASVVISYAQGMSMQRGANSFVYFNENKIVAGDRFLGTYCFDTEGNFIYTLVPGIEQAKYNTSKNEISMHWQDSIHMPVSFSMWEDHCILSTKKGNDILYHFHNLNSQKNYLVRPGSHGQAMLLNADTFIDYWYWPASPNTVPFMYLSAIKGDTLCSFMNYNDLPDIGKTPYANPEQSNLYYYNHTLTIRQAYNDTIYRVSDNALSPAFILHHGKRKSDVQTALKGEKSGKNFMYKLLETEHFLFTTHTENYDCPKNRENNSVKFRYSYFDKKERKLYRIPRNMFPEVFTLKCNIPGAIPVTAGNAMVYKDKLYTTYNHIQLKELIKSNAFASFPAAQQEKLKELHKELSDKELLILILK